MGDIRAFQLTLFGTGGLKEKEADEKCGWIRKILPTAIYWHLALHEAAGEQAASLFLDTWMRDDRDGLHWGAFFASVGTYVGTIYSGS